MALHGIWQQMGYGIQIYGALLQTKLCAVRHEFHQQLSRVLQAIDRDEGINSVVSYYIGGEIRRTLSEGLESLAGPPFLINHRTGDLSLNFYPQKGMKGYFDFEVIANDTEGFYDTASVFVSGFNFF